MKTEDTWRKLAEKNARIHKATIEGFREELETAWLRGYRAHKNGAESARIEGDSPGLEAADYAERVVGGSTRPRRPATLCAPSKDENAA